MLSPFLRLIPGGVADHAGAATWLSAGLSLVPLILLSAAITKLLRQFPPRTGLAQAILETLGPFPGSLLLSLWSLWLVFHSGFVLRSGADRFIATVYPNAKPAPFIWITLGLCVIAALGQVKATARAAELFRPLLLFVILLVIVFTLSEVEPTFLLPVTSEQLPGVVKGIPMAAEPVSVVLVNGAFLAKFTEPQPKSSGRFRWLIGITLLNLTLCLISVGSLGKTMVQALAYPFFIMARDLSILSGMERIEALVVGLWLLPDFILVSIELLIAGDTMGTIAGKDQSSKQTWVLIGAALAALFAFRIAPDRQRLLYWSDHLIPALHLGWAYLMVPLILLAAKLRKRF